jgi:phospholipid transport system substrate-binding protein
MHTALTRRRLLAVTAMTALVVACRLRPAYAQASGANAFVKSFADDLVGIVNGPNGNAQKKAALGPVIDSNVDVARIAKFCLGRFWSTATPAQQSEYTTLFHQVLLNEISGHLGDYRGVTYTMTGDMPQGESTLVGTVINRPNAPAANVKWVVDTSGGAPKVVDVIAEGTSMRLTQRNDYASYLSQHGNSIDALIEALKKQLAAAG